MIKLTIRETIKLFEEKGYFFNQDGLLNIVGFRNRFGRPNHFDDTIALMIKKKEAVAEYYLQATTLPGTPYLFKPENESGTAILVPGQYVGCYSVGKHRGKYPALVQTGAVQVYRDNTKDNVYDRDERTIQTGLFGINIHRAGLGARVVGVNSAGCQVVHSKSEFEWLMELVNHDYQEGVRTFTYTLVEI